MQVPKIAQIAQVDHPTRNDGEKTTNKTTEKEEESPAGHGVSSK